jgi:hypothetical protein
MKKDYETKDIDGFSACIEIKILSTKLIGKSETYN